MNYFDILLAKKLRGGGGGDITIKSLNVTQNGTYSEEGVAYSPVKVNVPLPENAYLLKEIENVEIATFTDGSDLPMPKLEVAVEPQQDLHGYDSPWVGGSGKNKFNKSTVNVDKYIGADGQLATSQYNQDVTDFIPVTSGQSYIINSSIDINNYSCFYDENKNVVGSVFANNQFPKVAPSDAKYIRVTFAKADINTFMVEQGTTASSTYYPYSNICPISGWDEVNVGVSGVNVWDEEWEVGSISDASGQDATNSNYRRSKNYISVKANKKYYFNVPSKYGTTYRFYQYKQNKDYIGIKTVDSDGTFETDNDCAFIRFRIATTEDYTNDISINYPSTDTSYHAYNGQTITLDLDGTRYGGKVDLVSGVMTVDRVRVSGLNWYEQSSETQKSYYSDVIDNIKIPTSTYATVGAISSNYIEGGSSNFVSSGDGKFCISQGRRININDNRYQSLADFKVAIPNIDIVYELATPLTIQLPTTVVKSLGGVNNISADSGNILDLSYLAKEE